MLPTIEVYRGGGRAHAAGAAAGRAAAGNVARRRAGAGPALRARHALDAPPWRSVRCVGLGPDARARRPAPARLRSRLRAVRPRRLAGRCSTRSPTPVRTACSPRTVMPSPGALSARAGPRGRRHSHRVGRRSAAPTITNDPLRQPVRRARCHQLHQRPRSRRWSRYLAEAPAADAAWAVFFLTGRRLKRLLSGRAIGAGRWRRRGLSDWLLGECYARGRRRRRNRGADPRSTPDRRRPAR